MKNRHLLILFLMALFGSWAGFAQIAAIPGSCILGAQKAQTSGLPSSNFMQGVVPQCLVTVYLTGTTTKASIFADQISTPRPNPFTAATNGQWLFYAAVNQGYDIVLSGGIAPNVYTVPVTLVALFPATNVITPSGTPAGPAFAVNFANSLVNAFQGDSSITINPTTHTFAAPSVVLTGLIPGTTPVCPNGTGGALTTLGCTSGTASNPAGPAFAVNFANSSVTNFQGDPTITINPTTHAFQAPVSSGSRYATGFGNGSTNGIASAAAAGATVVADPSYPLTEQYTISNMIPNVPNAFAFNDLRNGLDTNFHHTFPFNGQNFGTNIAIYDLCLTDGPTAAPAPGTTGSWTRSCHSIDNYDYSPGWSLNVNRWYSSHSMSATYFVNGSGITEILPLNLIHYGIGDTATLYVIVNGPGGFVTGSDEGTKAGAFATAELTSVPTGTCSTGCTTGSTNFKITPVVGNGTQWGTGRYARVTSQVPFSSSISSYSTSTLGGNSSTVVLVTAPASVSNAWGTLSGDCNQAIHNNTPPFTTSTTCNVVLVGGAGFSCAVGSTVTGTCPSSPAPPLICFKQTQHECTIPTAINFVSGSTWAITMPLRGTTHTNGTYVFQGGWAGYGMDVPFYDQTVNGQTFAYPFDVVGCTAVGSCEVVQWSSVGGIALPLSGYPGWSGASPTVPGSAVLASLSSNGTTVSGTYVTAGSTLVLTQYNKGTIIISGASDLALDGTCTNVIFTAGLGQFFTCTMAGLTSTHTAVSAAAMLAQPNGTAINAVSFFPMAAVMDVQNESLTPPFPDGTITVEANVLVINPGDTIEEMHHEAAKFSDMTIGATVYNPYNNFTGVATSSSGAGIQGVGAGFLQLGIGAGTDTTYKGLGGYQNPPNSILSNGAYSHFITTFNGPSLGNAMLNVSPTTAQRNDPNYNYNLLIGANLVGASTINFVPFTGASTYFPSGVLTIGGGAGTALSGNIGVMHISDFIQFQAISTPAAPTVTALAFGGTLADSTQYCYFTVTRNNSGSNAHGTETCATTGVSGGNNSVKIVWVHQAGAIGYNLCGRTTGAEALLTQPNGIDNTTFIDNGSLTPGAACSTTDTTLGFIDQAKNVNLNSSGTNFEAKLQSPASVAASYIENLPATGTAGTMVDMATSTSTTGAMPTFSNTQGRLQNNSGFIPVVITTSITPAAATTGQCAEQTFTFTGLLTGHPVAVSPPALINAHVWIGWSRVSSANTLAIGYCSDSTGGTPASGSYVAEQF